MKRSIIISLFFLLLWAAPARAEVRAMASIGPVKYLVERIGGDLVDVDVLVTPGASPATYEPKPKQMAALADSALLFAVGVPFEKTWLPRIASSNPNLLIVHTEEGIEKMPMLAHHEEGEEHGHNAPPAGERPEGPPPGARPDGPPPDHGHMGPPPDHDHEQAAGEEHHHGPLDPHVWTAPPLYQVMADNVLDALIRVDPAHEAEYRDNHAALSKDIRALDADLRELFDPLKGASFMVYHPAWGYFARTYGLNQIPVELEGKEPGPKELAAFIRLAEEKQVKAIFVQPQFSRKSATAIAGAVGATVIPVDPLAQDWLPGLRKAAKLLRSGLR